VLEEENVVKNDAKEGTVNPDVAVQVRGLAKTYPGTTQISCCKCKKTSSYHAVRVSNSYPTLEYHAGFGLQSSCCRISILYLVYAGLMGQLHQGSVILSAWTQWCRKNYNNELFNWHNTCDRWRW
jgi:hypothetical protein